MRMSRWINTAAVFSTSVRTIFASMVLALPAAGWTQFSGPSGVPAMTVQQLLARGRDEQHATLRGRILSHVGGDHYIFADQTGQMYVEIEAHHFPLGVKIDDKVLVEISGELDREFVGRSEFDVDRLSVVP